MTNGRHTEAGPVQPGQPPWAAGEPPEPPEQTPGPHEQPAPEEPIGSRLARWASWGLYGIGGSIAGLSAFDYAITNWRVDSLPHLAGNVALGAGFYFIGRGMHALSQEEPREIPGEGALRQFVDELEQRPLELPDGRRIVIQDPAGQEGQRGVVRRAWDRAADGYRRLGRREVAPYLTLGLAAWVAAAGVYTVIKPWKYVRDQGIPAAVEFTKEEAVPSVSGFVSTVYHDSTGSKKPGIWGRPCKYEGEPDENEKAIMEGLFPAPAEKYVPVKLNCRPERISAGLEYPDKDTRQKAYNNFTYGLISEVELADSRPGVYELGGKRYTWSPLGFHKER